MSVTSEQWMHMVKSLKLVRVMGPHPLISDGLGKALISLHMIFFPN